MRYSDTVMDHFMNPRNTGRLVDADGAGRIGSEECGDQLRVWIKVRDGKLIEVRHQVFGCPAAIAACSMMTQLATGLMVDQAMQLTDAAVAEALDGLPPAKYHCSNLAASALHEAIRNYQDGRQSPPETVTVTLLVNNAMPAPLAAEHGLAFWIDYAGKNILFDTGQSDAVVKNADLLDIDLSTADAVVLSHGHYDHTGGLAAVLNRAPKATIYLHPDAPRIRYSCPPGQPAKDISMPSAACGKIADCVSKGRVIYTLGPETVFPGITITGSIPRTTDYEDTGGPFYLDKEGQTPDALEDDQALVLNTANGLVVILGCGHAGLINTLEYAGMLTGRPIHAVFGGTHLRAASPQRLKKTCQALKNYSLRRLAPCHCTGDTALAALKARFPAAVIDPQANIRMTI